MLVTLTSMRRELQSQNRVNGDYEKTTGPIYLKFWPLIFQEMGVAGLMFEPHPPNFEKLYNF